MKTMKNNQLVIFLLLILTATVLSSCEPGAYGSYPNSRGGYSDPYSGGSYGGGYGDDYDRRRDRDRTRQEQRELDRERDRINAERDRLEREREEDQRRHERGRRTFPSPRIEEHCPSGYSPSEQKCSVEERRRGCKDMRLSGGLGCVRR